MTLIITQPTQRGAIPSQSGGGRLTRRMMIPLLCLSVLVARLVNRQTSTLGDPDTWWHLRAGEEFWANWGVDSPGWLSPFGEHEWIARDWLTQLVASKVYDLFGLSGVAWLAGAGVVALALVAWFGARRFADPLISGLAVAVVLLGSAESHSPRPQMVSFVLLTVFVAAWLVTARDGKPRWYLVPLMALWSCSHGMWIFGVAVSGVACLGMAMDGRRLRELLGPALVPFLGLGAAMLTPLGSQSLFGALRESSARAIVDEWQPASVLESPSALITLTALGVTGTCYARRGSTSWVKLLLVAMAAFLCVLSSRTIPLGAIIVGLLMADALQPLVSTSARTWSKREFLASTLLSVVALAVMIPAAAHPSIDRGLFPVGLNAKLAELPADSTVLNTYEVGGWLEWQHRQLVPVIDGNTPAYEPEYVGSYYRAMLMGPDWRNFVDSSGADYALIQTHLPIASGLHLIGWRELSRDGDFVLLQAPQR